MVQEVTAFQSSDGKMFSNKIDALTQELRNVLLQITGGNVGTADLIISNRSMLLEPMQALIAAESTPVEDIVNG